MTGLMSTEGSNELRDPSRVRHSWHRWRTHRRAVVDRARRENEQHVWELILMDALVEQRRVRNGRP